MAQQILNVGTTANDGTGDSLRVGGDKINDNFDEIYTTFGDGSTLTPFTTMSPGCISLSAIDIPSTSAAPEKTVNAGPTICLTLPGK